MAGARSFCIGMILLSSCLSLPSHGAPVQAMQRFFVFPTVLAGRVLHMKPPRRSRRDTVASAACLPRVPRGPKSSAVPRDRRLTETRKPTKVPFRGAIALRMPDKTPAVN